MGFLPLPVGGRGEHFGSRTSRNKRVRGSEEGGKAGGMPLGEVAF